MSELSQAELVVEDYCPGGQISFCVRINTLGLVPVFVEQSVTNTLISDASFWVSELRAPAVIFSKRLVADLTIQEAKARRIVIMVWPSITNLAGELLAVREASFQILAAAKIDSRSKLPAQTAHEVRELTPYERDLGFFFATKRVSCWFVDNASQDLLITFAQWSSDADKPSRWGVAYSSAGGYSCLGFETSEPNWFPDDDMDACVREAEKYINIDRFSKRLVFGVSQGGHGALKFSRKLGANTALAISPQYSIDPSIVAGSRFLDKYRTDLHSGMHIAQRDVASNIFIAYDPYDEDDVNHIGRLRKSIEVAEIPVPFGGHACTHILRQPRALVSLLQICHAGDVNKARRLAVLLRNQNVDRPYFMALRLSEGKPETGLKLFEKYGRNTSGSEWGHVCYRLASGGAGKKVLPWLIERALENPEDADRQALVSLVALKTNDINLATEFIARAILLRPKDQRLIEIRSRI